MNCFKKAIQVTAFLGVVVVFLAFSGRTAEALTPPNAAIDTYTKTCTNLSVTNTNQPVGDWTLVGQCENGQTAVQNGKTVHLTVSASLRGYALCAANNGAIVNANGVLECKPPPGSYLNSCTNPVMTYDGNLVPSPGGGLAPDNGGNILEANCKSGSAIVLSKYYLGGPCWTDLANVNGQIMCTPPSGSYQQSCRNIILLSSPASLVLEAQCQNPARVYQPASFLFTPAACTTGIVNASGKLGCQWPNGPYNTSCESMQMRNSANTNNGTDLLSAVCWTGGQLKSGQPNRSSLTEPLSCTIPNFASASITNVNGVLTCTPKGSTPPQNNGNPPFAPGGTSDLGESRCTLPDGASVSCRTEE